MRRKLIFSYCIFFIPAIILAQDPLKLKISVDIQSGSTSVALQQLETICACRFSYNPALIGADVPQLSFKNEPMEGALKKLLGDDVQCKVRGGYIILNRQEKVTPKEVNEISGTITDASSGKKLTNVSVYEVNKLTATLTDDQGKYNLTANAFDDEIILAITKKNYQDTVIRIPKEKRTTISISLKPSETKKENPRAQTQSKPIQNRKLREHDKNVALTEQHFFQVSLFPAVSTNGFLSGKVTNQVSLNLAAGYAYGLNGVELSGALNIEKADVKGVQIAGASNLVGGDMYGVQIGGASNHLKGKASGIQIAGAYNQAGSLKGVQLSGAWNHTADTLSGLQLSGFWNYAGVLNGVQLGIVNYARSAEKGTPIGIFNYVKDGFHVLEIGTNDLTPIQLSFKSGVPHFYTLLTSGIKQGDRGFWTYGLGMGSQFIQKQKFKLDVTFQYSELQPLEKWVNTGNSTHMRFDLLAGFKILKKVQINAGPVLHWYRYAWKPGDPALFIDSISKNTIFHKGQTDISKTSILWLGYQLNIRI